MKLLRRILVLAFVAVVLAGLVVHETGCLKERYGPDHPPGTPVAAEPVPAEVPRYEVAMRTVLQPQRAVGSVVPRTPVVVSARVMAAILDLPPRVGQRVEAGDTIAVLDRRELDARVSAAAAALAAAEARALAAQAETARAKAEETRAKSDRERMARLAERNAGTERDLEVAVAAAQSATASVAAAESAATAAGSAVEMARRELESAEIAASHAVVLAPRSGVISRRLAEPGEIVLPGGRLVELYDPADLRLEAAVPEADAARLQTGDAVRVLVPSTDLVLEATIDEIVPAADPVTRSVLVKVGLPHDAALRSGVRGTLVYPGEARDVLAIPASAVRRRGQVESVRVLQADGTALRRHVRTGEDLGDGLVEVLTGLAQGETVVGEGQ